MKMLQFEGVIENEAVASIEEQKRVLNLFLPAAGLFQIYPCIVGTCMLCMRLRH